MARMHRRYSKRRKGSGSDPGPAPKRNPPLFTDLLEFVGPGFGSFAVTRFATHIATTQIAKRKPAWGKHAGAGVSVGAFLAAWFLGHRIKMVAKYHTPIVVGSAIAAIQSLLQLYFPKLGWMVSDASPELAAPAQPMATLDPAHLDLVPTNHDPNEYTYNDEYDAGRMSHTGGGPAPAGAPASSGQADASIADLELDDAIGQTANMGVFSN